jgi:Ca2+-binding RTX toxin-like protein
MPTIHGTNCSEYLYGTNYGDIIYGYGGHDVLYGFDGNDTLYGGAGNDDLIGGLGTNNLWGGGGSDWFIMSARAAGASDDWIGDFQFGLDRIDVAAWGVSDFSQIKELLNVDSTGSAWFNASYNGYNHFLTIDGIAPSQLIASDFVYSDSGPKNQTGTAYADTLFGSRLNDTLRGAGGNDVLLGGMGHDSLYGGGGGDRLSGGTGNDKLFGQAGNDRLIGGAGADDLNGGAGSDILTGGPGYDAFVFSHYSHSRPNAARDRITDFQPDTDFIDLAAIDARLDLAGNQAFTWIGGAGFSGPGQLRYGYSGSDTIISGSVDGPAGGVPDRACRPFYVDRRRFRALTASAGRQGRKLSSSPIPVEGKAMKIIHEFEEMKPEKQPQNPEGDGTGLTFETLEHGVEHPDRMPMAIRMTGAEGQLMRLCADQG